MLGGGTPGLRLTTELRLRRWHGSGEHRRKALRSLKAVLDIVGERSLVGA